MEQGTSFQTVVAKNNGSKIHHWKSHLLFSSLIILLFCSCAKDETPNFEWVKVDKGNCDFGTDNDMVEESPSNSIQVTSFEISATPVTNKMFEQFVKATGYKTEAENNNGSIYYDGNDWKIDTAMNWRHPYGKNSEYKNLLNHPVVCISYNDAKAFCEWAKVRLPTEIEWEFACEKGNTNSKHINIDQRDSDQLNNSDHFNYTSPVKTFPANDLGLYDMLGNVWEICEDNYLFNIHELLLYQKFPITQQAYKGASSTLIENKTSVDYKVIKGGSFLCFKKYCYGYRSDARQYAPINESYFHIGFRVARDLP